MSDPNTSPTWTTHFPALQRITDPVWLHSAQQAQLKEYAVGTVLFSAGQHCSYYPLVIDGIVNVQKISEDGHEITLYHIQPGHSCELTTSCLIGGSRYHANGTTATEARVVLIPKQAFLNALAGSEGFRSYIYNTIDSGMNELAELVEAVAFAPMGQRLAHYLFDAATHENPVNITHHHVATELGTAREVVSRLLKSFERQGWIKIRRGQIEVIDQRQLYDLIKQRPL